MSGFSAGDGPGEQTGKCLFGMGIGHGAEVFKLSKVRLVDRLGSGEEERCGAIGRGMAMVAIEGKSNSCLHPGAINAQLLPKYSPQRANSHRQNLLSMSFDTGDAGFGPCGR